MKWLSSFALPAAFKYSQGTRALLRFAPRLTPIASVLFFNELLTQNNSKLAAMYESCMSL
ncbi:hypothetical protein D3871_17820 [Noviherbaspirillum saxi]|uniref:Uncharacterized protein n=1 Tax=Noviherbaspirillum saxi TaxID=2320863 RepID=A0A3A3FIH0_9BURK|nr:hypothetical protein D3871_17820 [Noviherbaspirillum saxi]